MNRITIPSLDASPEASKPVLNAVLKQLGVVPNLFRLVGNSPLALSGFSNFQAALSKTLDAKTRERIALAVAQVNGCDYCLSAHTYLGLNLVNLTQEEITQNRQGGSHDQKANVAVAFATSVTKNRGHVGDDEIKSVRDAGFSQGQIVEIVAIVAENCFTNFINNVAKTEIDFPIVSANQL
jgi:uncharacterized peroxidase-related enzyme